MSASVISGIGELVVRISECHSNRRQNIHSQVEHDGKQEDEACNSQIDPLHILQCPLVVTDVIEDGVRSDDWCYDRANTKQRQSIPMATVTFFIQHSPIERLREVDTDFRVLRRTTNGNVRVCSSFQTPQAITNDEDGGAETTKRAVQDARPCHQRSLGLLAMLVGIRYTESLTRFRRGTSPR